MPAQVHAAISGGYMRLHGRAGRARRLLPVAFFLKRDFIVAASSQHFEEFSERCSKEEEKNSLALQARRKETCTCEVGMLSRSSLGRLWVSSMFRFISSDANFIPLSKRFPSFNVFRVH